MSVYALLQANCENLVKAYNDNIAEAQELQETLINQVLPALATELQFSDDVVAESKAWLGNTLSIFHFLRRNAYTRSFAMETIRKALLWRVEHREQFNRQFEQSPALLHLPHSFDRLGHPVVILRASELNFNDRDFKSSIIQQMEQLRICLLDLRDSERRVGLPLQYVIILDLSALSMRNMNIDLSSWIAREVVPRFPGMFAAAFLINYSWTHAGIWNLVKHILPSTALSRVIHASRAELDNYFEQNALPEEYGGNLPTSPHLASRVSRQLILSENDDTPSVHSSPEIQTHIESISDSLSPISFLNPFFGYPVSSNVPTRKSHMRRPSRHVLPHGRRRKRDLAKTLLTLLWIRWRGRASYVLAIAIFAYFIKGRRWLSYIYPWRYWLS